MKKWLAIGALAVVVAVLTFYLRQERDDQPVLAAKSEQSSAIPAPNPAPLQPDHLAPSEPAGQKAPPSELPPKPSDDEFKAPLQKNSSALKPEVSDQIWVLAMEDGMRNYYGGIADLVAYGMPTVECKSNLCEARVRASGVNGKELFELQRKSTQPMVLPVGTHLNGVSVKTGDQQGGVTEFTVSTSYYRTTEQP